MCLYLKNKYYKYKYINMENNINPECLGAVLINGVYHDKKTAKFLLLKGQQNILTKNDDVNETFYNRFLNLFKSK